MVMRLRLPIVLVGLALLIGLGPVPARAQRVEPGGAPPAGSGPIDVNTFVRVIDGDTIETWIDGKRVGIGLSGVSAPAGNTDCGRQAAARLRNLVKGGLRLEEEPSTTFDGRGRRIYRARTRDGRSVAEELLKDGVAQVDARATEGPRLAAAEAQARASQTGCVWRGRTSEAPGGATFAKLSLDADASFSVVGSPAPATVAAPPIGAPRVAAPLATTLPSGFAEDLVAAGLVEPTAVAFLPDGRILIAEKHGVVKLFKNGAVLTTPFIDIQDRVNDYWDHGLLGIAADPSFATNGFVYLLYTYENNAADYTGTKTARLARYTASGDTAAVSSQQVILGTSVGSSCNTFPAGTDCLPSDSPSHSIGNIKFASNGTMFVTAGDGAHFNFVDDNALRAQQLDLLAGKVLRITTNGQGLTSNPFYGPANNCTSTAANCSKVWARGIRNAYRFGLRPGTDLPYLGDVGWNTWEELDVVTAGANLGWPCYEGNARQSGYEPKPDCQTLYGLGSSAVRAPLVAYNHNGNSAAATGGAFYTGTTYPSQYQGAYFYADYAQGWIRYISVDANNNLVSGPTGVATGAGGPVDLEMGPDQSLYYLDILGGELRRIRYGSAPPPPTSCPTGQYLAEYFNSRTLSGTPTGSRCEANPINYDWGTAGPTGVGVGVDNFSVRWTGRHTFSSGSHTFTATADDGIRVWLDGALIVDAWVDQAATTYTATRTLTAGEHEVKVEYYDNEYGAVAQVSWTGAGGGNQPPTPTIGAPSSTQTFQVGDVVSYSGSATDPEDGTIPASGLSWTVTIQHCTGGNCHAHTLIPPTVGTGGSFTAPDHEEDFYLEIKLVATDSGGLTGTTTVALQPRTSQVTLATAPSGLQVTYNGTSYPAPRTFTPIVGGTRTIAAPSPQGGATFASWSDGGAQQHNVTVPATNTTYTATFNSTTATPTATATTSQAMPPSPAGGATATPTATATASQAMPPSPAGGATAAPTATATASQAMPPSRADGTTAAPTATATPTATVPAPAGAATPTATATVAPPASYCAPRPGVTASATPSAPGRLRVTIAAGTSAATPANRLVRIQVGYADNGVVEVGEPAAPLGAVLELPERPQQVTLSVRRLDPGAPTTVQLVVTDDCGAWPTFVGGGPGAF